MNFQKLVPVEKADTYLDIAFGKAKANAAHQRKRLNVQPAIRKAKLVERTRFDIVNDLLTERLKKIQSMFPEFDKLPVFYSELASVTLDMNHLKKALGSVVWAWKRINSIHNEYIKRINAAEDETQLHGLRNSYYGRISSIVKDADFEYLESARKLMRSYPDIKDMPTIAIAGFPNVGKSTLLSRLTGAKPEIASYAFTTKKLNAGYIKLDDTTLQLIDTPGTLARPEKMNNIEKQAYLALKHLANRIIFVIDPTDDIDRQETLLDLVKKEGKPITLFMSKTDIADKKTIQSLKNKHPEIITELSSLAQFLTQ